MSAKATVIFCTQALFIQCAVSQYIGRAAPLAAPCGLAVPYDLAAPALAAPYSLAAPCGYAAPAIDFTPTSDGGLPVASASAIAPVGLSVDSENIYEDILASTGELPFVGTEAVEGIVPSAGVGAVNHACGNGVNAMFSEGAAFAPYGAIAPAAAVAPFGAGIAPYGAAYATALAAPALAAPFGYRAGLGCGCAL